MRLWRSDGKWQKSDGKWGQNYGFPNSLNTPAFLFVDATLLGRSFIFHHKHLIWEVVLQSWERFHSPSNMWNCTGHEYHPYRVLIFGMLGSHDLHLGCWILQDRSMVRNNRPCWWVHDTYHVVNHRDTWYCDIILRRWILHGGSTVKGDGAIPLPDPNSFYWCPYLRFRSISNFYYVCNL